ncbi:MAG: alpha/beta fold hydrolase [Chthoniobacteraceae bacterium]
MRSLVLLALASAALRAADVPEILATEDGVRFGLWPHRPAQAAPIVFVLSGAIDDSLTSRYFRQAAQFLIEDGIVCVSVDLPCHGQDSRPKDSGLGGWRARAVAGNDFVADVTTRLRKVLDHLIKSGIADPQRIAALGTSRGGFVALHFAAADTRVKAVMGFAPLIDLAKISEFRGAEDDPLVQKLALEKQADALAGRSVWLVIGDRDARVSTDATIAFARAVTAASLAKSLPALVDLHVIAEPKGHTVPAGTAELGAKWLREKLLK